MAKQNNKIFKFTIVASGDSWEVCDTENIKQEKAESIAEEISVLRGIFCDTDGYYEGENIEVTGEYGKKEIHLNTISLYEEASVDKIYATNDEINKEKELLEEIINIIMEYTSDMERGSVHIYQNVELSHYTDCENVDTEVLYDINKWKIALDILCLKRREEKQEETLTLKNKVKQHGNT